jgi:predicted dehydrogenase
MTKSHDKKLRVGVIGAGIGHLHLIGYAKADNVEIAAICDINEDRARHAAKEFGSAHVFTNHKTMLTEAHVDAVSVCTPNALHAEMVIDCLEAGKHVLCEKPMADTLDGARRIVGAASAAEKRGQVFMMAMNNRFRADSAFLKKQVESGAFGDIYFAKCGWIRRNGIPGFGGWFTTKSLSGGGPLIDLGVHVMDLAIYLMGNPAPVSVFGASYAKFGPRGLGLAPWSQPGSGSKNYDVEDLATGMIKFDNGATLFVETSWASHIKEEKLYLSLIGTEGGADLEPLAVHTAIQGTPVEILPDTGSGSGGHEAEVRFFVDCAHGKQKPISSAEEGLHILQIIDGIYRSAETGHEVVIER